MQYMLDMNVNAKISHDLVHKLPYKCYTIWPLVLWPCPEDFEKLAYSEEFDVFELVTLMASRMCCCFFVEVLS